MIDEKHGTMAKPSGGDGRRIDSGVPPVIKACEAGKRTTDELKKRIRIDRSINYVVVSDSRGRRKMV